LNHDRTDGHRRRSKFNTTSGLAKIGYKLNENLNLDAHLSFAKIYNENPGKIGDPVIDNKMDLLRRSASLSLENSYKYASGAAQVFYNSGDHLINDGFSINKSPKPYLFNSIDHNYGLMVHETFNLFPGSSFTLGFDFKNWGGKAWNESVETAAKKYLTDRRTYETAGYVIVQQDFSDMLTINGGIRFEYNSSFGDAWVPQIGLSFRPLQGSVIKALISKGYKSPTIREMYMFPPQNPYLIPENMINYELSVGQLFLDSRLTTEVNLFYIDGWNMIETVTLDGIPKNLNTGYFNNSGVELQASYRVKPELRFDFNYSFLKTSKPMLAAPAHKLFLGTDYSYSKFLLNANMQYIGDIYLNTATRATKSYIVLNLNVSYKFNLMGIETRFFINGNNLTGTAYSVNEGFPMPGATVIAGIDVSF
ncbi:MAG: TonB-dependent receptor, partial [Bacteroidales bacterium]